MLQFDQSAIHRIFVVRVVFVKATFSCLNLKPDDGFLAYSIPDIFNKTGYGLTNIIISWRSIYASAEIFGNNRIYIYIYIYIYILHYLK